MIIDFSKQILDINNKPMIKESVAEMDENGNHTGKMIPSYLLLRDVSVNSLVQPLKDDKTDGNWKLKCWKLACAIRDSVAPFNISTEDVAMLKERIAKFYTVPVCGQVYEMFESVGK